MENNWKYVVKLTDNNAVKKIENITGVKAPDGFADFIKRSNGGLPTKKHVDIKGFERVFGSVLSFNENDKNTEDVYMALKIINKNGIIPFAIDPFGNFFCYSGATQTVIFWNHEDDEVDDSKMSFHKFIDSLH